ncbi:unnamed protein product [Echinostoma caproni]|uniref:RTC domain-containing protein n=1 Tax=Echinostoma caproni TaxID=27848 RepID=A0A183BGW3_9TREM|nr:unnamed protein product [Echinostoma caproni]
MKSIEIVDIRHRSMQPGVTNAEVSLLQLIDEISNGTVAKINDTGTAVTFKPGILTGGKVDFDCSTERGIGYYVEFLLLISPFCRQPLEIRLRGVTNSLTDPSIEMIKQAWLPIYRCLIGASAAASLKLEIVKRGVSPLGGGEDVLQNALSGLANGGVELHPEDRVLDLDYAYYIALLGYNTQTVQHALTHLSMEVSKYGMRLHHPSAVFVQD